MVILKHSAQKWEEYTMHRNFLQYIKLCRCFVVFMPFNILCSICYHINNNIKKIIQKNASSRFTFIYSKMDHLIDFLFNLALTVVFFSSLELTILGFNVCAILLVREIWSCVLKVFKIHVIITFDT